MGNLLSMSMCLSTYNMNEGLSIHVMRARVCVEGAGRKMS